MKRLKFFVVLICTGFYTYAIYKYNVSFKQSMLMFIPAYVIGGMMWSIVFGSSKDD